MGVHLRLTGRRAKVCAASCAAIAALAAASSPPVSAATGVGGVFVPSGGCNFPGTITTYFQSSSPGDQYVVPSPGVITSWSTQSGATTPRSLRLKLGRSVGGNDYMVVAESTSVRPLPNTVNSYPTRIPVSGGELLGLTVVFSNDGCPFSGAAGPQFTLAAGANDDPPVGSTNFHNPNAGGRLDIAAILEPDSDRDGFGDETQDACPTDASTQGACPVPDTTLGATPKAKTKKGKALFEFSSSIAGSGFECSLDGGAFEPCASPHEVKVKKGKHTFAVRATAGGQTDASPATFDWKVKK